MKTIKNDGCLLTMTIIGTVTLFVASVSVLVMLFNYLAV